MLGSRSEAEDAVQNAWLRISRADTTAVDNLGGWLTTVVARVCLNMLRSRASRREERLDASVGQTVAATGPGIEAEQALGDSVGVAMADGAVGAVWAPGGQPRVVFRFTVAEGMVTAIDLISDPDSLRRIDLAALDD